MLFDKWQKEPANEGLQNELIKLLQKHAYAVCWNKLSEHRPDIVNDAVWRVISRHESFRGESLFSTWFQTIVQNLCNSALREKRTRRGEVSLDEVTADVCGVEEQDVLVALELEQTLSGLTATDMSFVDMKREGLSDNEIGDILGINATAVRQHWLRVRRRIKRNLDGSI